MISDSSLPEFMRGKNLSDYRSYYRHALFAIFVVGAHIYAGFAIAHDYRKPTIVYVTIGVFYLTVLYLYFLESRLKSAAPGLKRGFGVVLDVWRYRWKGILVVQFGTLFLLVAAFSTWLIIDSVGSRIRLRSVAGVAVYVLLAVCLSANPARIKWRPVIGGLVLQALVAIVVLRIPAGNAAFKWLSEQAVTFLDYAYVGANFAYQWVTVPPKICDFSLHTAFVYTALQIIIYFGAVVSVLYYLGIIQFVLSKVAWVMGHTVGTTAAESLNAAACIFLGQTEAAILIEPALHTMTESEINAVMTAGFACIAGSLFSAYISFGACPEYLLSATVMSAAVSLAYSKILVPETQISRQRKAKDFKFADRNESSGMHQ
ncbi:transporter gate domain protein [Aphelenchoides avenae]|nr:transporter gate domain protein [Aphelenchus avenae]